jgi:hypothetical protein
MTLSKLEDLAMVMVERVVAVEELEEVQNLDQM